MARRDDHDADCAAHRSIQWVNDVRRDAAEERSRRFGLPQLCERRRGCGRGETEAAG